MENMAQQQDNAGVLLSYNTGSAAVHSSTSAFNMSSAACNTSTAAFATPKLLCTAVLLPLYFLCSNHRRFRLFLRVNNYDAICRVFSCVYIAQRALIVCPSSVSSLVFLLL